MPCTYYDSGSFLMFNLGPARKVFIDGRLNLYEHGAVFRDYLAASWTEKGLWALLSKYDIDSCLVPQGTVQAALLSASPQWKQVYQDRLRLLFVREREQVHARAAAASPRKTTKPNGII